LKSSLIIDTPGIQKNCKKIKKRRQKKGPIDGDGTPSSMHRAGCQDIRIFPLLFLNLFNISFKIQMWLKTNLSINKGGENEENDLFALCIGGSDQYGAVGGKEAGCRFLRPG
jgi:hypothetical protein